MAEQALTFSSLTVYLRRSERTEMAKFHNGTVIFAANPTCYVITEKGRVTIFTEKSVEGFTLTPPAA
jgi:hypothetical protein